MVNTITGPIRWLRDMLFVGLLLCTGYVTFVTVSLFGTVTDSTSPDRQLREYIDSTHKEHAATRSESAESQTPSRYQPSDDEIAEVISMVIDHFGHELDHRVTVFDRWRVLVLDHTIAFEESLTPEDGADALGFFVNGPRSPDIPRETLVDLSRRAIRSRMLTDLELTHRIKIVNQKKFSSYKKGEIFTYWELPKGITAAIRVYQPGFSADGCSAVFIASIDSSPHGGIIVAVLTRRTTDSPWNIDDYRIGWFA